MKIDTKGLINWEMSVEELGQAFQQLPTDLNTPTHRYAVNFTLTDGFGKPCERALLFFWNQDQQQWELNTKAHNLIITSSPS